MNDPNVIQTAKDLTEGLASIPIEKQREVVDAAIAAAPDLMAETEAVKGAEKKPPQLQDYLVDHFCTLDMSPEEIEALRKPVIVEGFLRHGTVMLLAAEAKSRKSWLAQDLTFAARAGIKWLPLFDGSGGFETKQTIVHVLDLELDPDEMRYRHAKVVGHRFKDNRNGAEMVTKNLRSYSLDGMGAEGILALVAQLEPQVKPGEIVVVDCFYRLVPDANEAEKVAGVLEAFKRFAASTQAGVVIVDHFRKAGDDKARNRITGSAVKMYSASTLVSVEVKDDILSLNIDARTFHGFPLVTVRFDLDSYTFIQVAQEELQEVKEAAAEGKAKAHLTQLYRGRPISAPVTAAEALKAWGVTKQAAGKRLNALYDAGFLDKSDAATGTAIDWKISTKGTLSLDGEHPNFNRKPLAA